MASANIQTIDAKRPEKTYLSVYAECNDTKVAKYLESRINELLRFRSIIGRDLKIQCNLLDFDTGNRFLRYMVGFGAGAASSVIEIKLFNNNSDEIKRFEIATKLTMGAFGGNDKEMIEAATVKIVDYVQKNYIK